MKKIFLRMKHWQLFLLLFLPSLLMGGCLMYSFPSIAELEQARGSFNPEEIISSVVNTIPLMFITIFAWACYMLTLLFALNDRVPLPLKRNMAFPVFALVFPMLYSLAACGFVMYLFQNLLANNMNIFEGASESTILVVVGIVVPCHFLVIFLSFYLFFVLAKLMKTAELQRKPDGDEFIGEFFLFWFFFVGIWILQPRINKMFEQEELD